MWWRRPGRGGEGVRSVCGGILSLSAVGLGRRGSGGWLWAVGMSLDSWVRRCGKLRVRSFFTGMELRHLGMKYLIVL